MQTAGLIAQYVVEFFAFSFVGWVYECTYCTFRTGRWQNRGFLFGPICPIYGAGAVAAVVIFGLLPTFSADTPLYQVFLISCAGSAVLEFATSWVLEKFFHAVWWDYSNIPLNIQGRICLPATLGFGVAGVVIVRYILPWLSTLHLEGHPVRNEILSLAFVFLMGADLAITVDTLIKLVSRMEKAQQSFNEKMQAGVDRTKAGVQLLKEGPAAVGQAARQGIDSARVQANLAEMELQAKMKVYAEELTYRERYHLSTIRGFRSEGTRVMAGKFRDYMKGIGQKLITPEDREVNRRG